MPVANVNACVISRLIWTESKLMTSLSENVRRNDTALATYVYIYSPVELATSIAFVNGPTRKSEPRHLDYFDSWLWMHTPSS
jgi:hypothetical protein